MNQVVHIKIILGDFSSKVRQEDIFKPTIGKQSLHKISNVNGVRLLNFATSNNLIVKSTTLSHRDIHKQTWTSPDGLTHNQIDHILIDTRRQSSIIDIRSIRGPDCDTDHYSVIAKLRERLSVTQMSRLDSWHRFYVTKVKDEEIKPQWQVQFSDRFDALRTSNEDAEEVDINDRWENIRHNIKVAAGESIGFFQVKRNRGLMTIVRM